MVIKNITTTTKITTTITTGTRKPEPDVRQRSRHIYA